MSTWTERKIAHDLSERDSIEPPEGLLDKIKSEIPQDLGSRLPAAALREAQAAQVVALDDRRMPRRQRWLLAASLILMVGAGLFATVVMRQTVSMEEVAEEEAPASPRAAAAPAPQRSEFPADSTGTEPAEPPEAEPAPATQLSATPEKKQSLRALGSVGAEAPKEEPAPLVFHDLPLDQERQDADDQRKRKPQAVVLSETAPPPPPPPPAAPAPELPESVVAGAQGGVSGGVVGGTPGGVVSGGANEMARQARAEEDGPPRDMTFQSAGSHPFVETARDRLSTFALDVDTASYTVARRSLREGHLPPREAIRVEELLNYFSYGDPPPARGDFALRAEGAASIFTQEPRTYLVRFNLRAREVKAEELTGTVPAIAEDAKVRVEFFPAAVARWRLIGYESRDIPDEKLRDDAVDAGEIGAGQSVTALYEVQLTPEASRTTAGKIASLHLRYRVPVTGELRETVRDLRASELVPDWKDASPGFRLASLVAEFAETLRGSSQAGDLRKILRRAQQVVEEMAGQPRAAAADFAWLVEAAARIREGVEKQ